jgi:hypothetical protein
MDLFTRVALNSLLAEHPSPCISLYMPTHRGGAQEDPIRWRKLLAKANESLASAGWRAAEIKQWLAPAARLLEDTEFWKNQSDGLAAFLAPEFMRLYRLPLMFRDAVVFASQFAIIPLLPLLSGNGRFFVLALSQKAVRLLQGTRYSVSEVGLTGVPQNLAEALLAHEAVQPFSFFGRRAGEGAGSWGTIFAARVLGSTIPRGSCCTTSRRSTVGFTRFSRKRRRPWSSQPSNTSSQSTARPTVMHTCWKKELKATRIG